MPRNTARNYVGIFVNSQKFVSDVYMEYIADMKYQVQHLYLGQYFIHQEYDQNVLNLY